MNEIHQPQMEEEFDFKETIKTTVKFWKIILPLVILGGLLLSAYSYMHQKTAASATVYINNSQFTNQMVNDENNKAIADKLGISLEKLPEVTIQSVKANSNLFTIVASTNNLKTNIDLDNAWAELLITKGKESEAEQANAAINSANKDLEKATQDLTAFLAKNNLSYLTYSQLEELTGNNILAGGIIVMQQEGGSLPVLPPDELTQLSQLLQAKLSAQQVYSQIYRDNQTLLYNLDTGNDYSIVEFAKVPDISLKSMIVNFFLGALVVLILGIVVVFIAQWWKKPTSEK